MHNSTNGQDSATFHLDQAEKFAIELCTKCTSTQLAEAYAVFFKTIFDFVEMKTSALEKDFCEIKDAKRFILSLQTTNQ